jgi:hypothetical protein
MSQARRLPLLVAIAPIFALTIGSLSACGSGDKKSTSTQSNVQTVRFEKPESTPKDSFTKPVDVKGSTSVPVSSGGSSSGGSSSSGTGTTGHGPFGGSGSDKVCDRDLLIKSLEARPDRMREWARVLGIEPNITAVKEYIAKLHPVTLTRDTRVTNHTFTNGKAVPLQSILAAGTTVLVDNYGRPVVRCRCGNPLTPPEFTSTAKCYGCPTNYHPPKQCDYNTQTNYGREFYPDTSYSNADYDQIFTSSKGGKYKDCYAVYPDPPVVTLVDAYPQSQTSTRTQQPDQGQQTQTQTAPTQTETTPTQTETQTQTEQTDICHDGIDNEGVPGLVDGQDPNCQ